MRRTYCCQFRTDPRTVTGSPVRLLPLGSAATVKEHADHFREVCVELIGRMPLTVRAWKSGHVTYKEVCVRTALNHGSKSMHPEAPSSRRKLFYVSDRRYYDSTDRGLGFAPRGRALSLRDAFATGLNSRAGLRQRQQSSNVQVASRMQERVEVRVKLGIGDRQIG